MSGRGSGNGRRRGGTRESRSMIAGRRPSRPAAEAETETVENEAPVEKAEDVATAPEAVEEAAPKKTPRRRRSRAKKVEAAESPVDTVSGDQPAEAAPEKEEAPVAPAAEPAAASEPAVASEPAAAPEPAAASEPAAPAAPTPRRRASALTIALEERLERLGTEIAGQHSALLQLGASVDELSARLDRAARKPRLGVFVDVPNVLYGLEAGEPPLDMGKLLAMLSDGRELVRATAYAPVSDDPREAVERQKFVAPFVPYAYRIVTKPLKRFADGSVKGNFDVEMAIDLVTMSERLDVVAIVSGDSDFARAVETVQSRGVRVEVVAFAGSTSIEMRALADHYLELDRVTTQLR